jgi:hypothetical protein
MGSDWDGDDEKELARRWPPPPPPPSLLADWKRGATARGWATYQDTTTNQHPPAPLRATARRVDGRVLTDGDTREREKGRRREQDGHDEDDGKREKRGERTAGGTNEQGERGNGEGPAGGERWGGPNDDTPSFGSQVFSPLTGDEGTTAGTGGRKTRGMGTRAEETLTPTSPVSFSLLFRATDECQGPRTPTDAPPTPSPTGSRDGSEEQPRGQGLAATTPPRPSTQHRRRKQLLAGWMGGAGTPGMRDKTMGTTTWT